MVWCLCTFIFGIILTLGRKCVYKLSKSSATTRNIDKILSFSLLPRISYTNYSLESVCVCVCCVLIDTYNVFFFICFLFQKEKKTSAINGRVFLLPHFSRKSIEFSIKMGKNSYWFTTNKSMMTMMWWTKKKTKIKMPKSLFQFFSS